MYWYKVKTLLIGLFAAINVFLIIFIVQGKVRQGLYEKNEFQSLVSVLKSNGIEVEESIFQSKNDPVRTATVENLTPTGEEMAKVLLGEGFATLPEGESIKYELNGKTVMVDGGKFIYNDANLVADKNLSEDKINMARELLKKYGIDVSVAEGKISGDKIVFTYYFGGLPLFENTLYVKMSGNAPSEIGGYVIGFKDLGDKTVEVASPKDALVDFLRDEKRENVKQKVVSVSLGYSALLADPSVHFKNTETIPTYKITTDSNKVYYYDARP